MKKSFTVIMCLFNCLVLCWSCFGVTISQSDYEALLAYAKRTDTQADAVDVSAEVETSAVAVNAKAAVLMEKSTGKILYKLNENERLYPASVTKIMTLLLVCEAIDSGKISLTDTVSASDNAASKGGSQIWLKVGETMTVDELLKAAAVYSANDACTALGEYVSGSEDAFIALMNERAKELGMNDTHFDNCTGLDDTTETHLTTANDIALMSRELIKHDLIKNYSTIWMDSLRDGTTELVNTNRLVRFYEGCTGLKTGTTSKAGCCISATAERNGMELIAVVLGSPDSNARFNSAKALLDWGFSNYETVVPEPDLSGIAPVPVLHGVEEYVDPEIPQVGSVLINKGGSSKVTSEIETVKSVEAPVEKGQILGKISVYYDGELLGEYDITAEKEIKQMKFSDALMKILTSFGKVR